MALMSSPGARSFTSLSISKDLLTLSKSFSNLPSNYFHQPLSGIEHYAILLGHSVTQYIKSPPSWNSTKTKLANSANNGAISMIDAAAVKSHLL